MKLNSQVTVIRVDQCVVCLSKIETEFSLVSKPTRLVLIAIMDHKRVQILNRMLSKYTECSGLDAKVFCFERMLDQFGVKITEQQFEKILSVLTDEQLDQVEKGLESNKNWF